jgi:hypothetical protein
MMRECLVPKDLARTTQLGGLHIRTTLDALQVQHYAVNCSDQLSRYAKVQLVVKNFGKWIIRIQLGLRAAFASGWLATFPNFQ